MGRVGDSRFGLCNLGLLLVAAVGAGWFVLAEIRSESPLIRFARLRDPLLMGGLVTSVLVATVVTATLVVGPFYLVRGLGLETAVVGLALSVGPVVAVLAAVPAGRLADRFGAQCMTLVGLIGMALGSGALSLLPESFGVPGYLGPIIVITAAYGLFQTANNTAVMAGIAPEQSGVISGLLNLSRNLGRITGASVMGAVFVLGTATGDVTTANPAAIGTGLRVTFAVAAGLVVAALLAAVGSRALAGRQPAPRDTTCAKPEKCGVPGERSPASQAFGFARGR